MPQLSLSISPAALERAQSLDVETLYASAQEATEQSHAPYSRFRVGAALMTQDGQVVTGSNVENISYGLTICAERVAATRAIAEGHQRFQAIAIAVAGETGFATIGAPCGACLQVLSEFDPNGELLVIFPEREGLRVASMSDLLPTRFA